MFYVISSIFSLRICSPLPPPHYVFFFVSFSVFLPDSLFGGVFGFCLCYSCLKCHRFWTPVPTSVNELTTDCQLLSQGCKPACQNLRWGESYRKCLVGLRLNFPFPMWWWKCFPTCSSVSLPFFSDTWSHQFLSLSIVFWCEVFATYWAPSAGRMLAEFSVFLVCSVNWTSVLQLQNWLSLPILLVLWVNPLPPCFFYRYFWGTLGRSRGRDWLVLPCY